MDWQCFDHLIQVGRPRFLCLSQNSDLLVEIVDLLILLVSESAKIRTVYINYFEGNDLLTVCLTTGTELARLKLQQERHSPLVHSTKRSLANEFLECVSWSSGARSFTLLNNCCFLAFCHTDRFATMFCHRHRGLGVQQIHIFRCLVGILGGCSQLGSLAFRDF
jgi:hypothetical protein